MEPIGPKYMIDEDFEESKEDEEMLLADLLEK